MPTIRRRTFAMGAPIALAAAAHRLVGARDLERRGPAPLDGAPAVDPPVAPQAVAATPRVRRSFSDAGEGQLHVRLVLQARSSSAVPLVCLHDAPWSGRVFGPWLTSLGESRDVLAPDLPGYGDSDPPPAPPAVGDYAWAIGRLIDALGLRRVDLVGIGVGALVAVDLAVERGAFVRRLVLGSVPVFDQAARQTALNALGPPRLDASGAHWQRVWAELWAERVPTASAEAVADAFADRVASLTRDWWGDRAAFDYATAARLARVTQPSLVLRSSRRGSADAERVVGVMSSARLAPAGELATGDFSSNVAGFIGVAREFLDRA